MGLVNVCVIDPFIVRDFYINKSMVGLKLYIVPY